MAFRLMENAVGAIDESRGITVKMAFRFADIDNSVPFDYIEGELTFGFDTEAEDGIPVGGALIDGESQPRPNTLVTHVLESSVREGLIRSLGPDALHKVDYERIKEDILEAVFVTASDNGRYLRLVPHYKVDFIP
ncbi:hypothetical protein KPL74_21620 [Bacillus sp. NP157]|nr:hypothetical protein KPL74_21620 [Bacillus sp. NP157]